MNVTLGKLIEIALSIDTRAYIGLGLMYHRIDGMGNILWPYAYVASLLAVSGAIGIVPKAKDD